MAELIQILRNFKWEILGKYFGCAHDSTIGFLSSQWIAADPENHAIIDWPPCVHIDVGGQDRRRHADILMFSNNRPALVVEVDQVGKPPVYYQTKIAVLQAYISDFGEALHGLLVLYGEKDGVTINYVQKLLADNSHSILLLHIEAENEWQQLQHKE
ncbi:MAG: hypothetical protein ABIK44_05245, partial [candidate division WOR-3 bacterium]